MKHKRPRFYFSFRSPYSWLAARYIGKRTHLPESEIEYIPFWEPDAVSLELLQVRGGEWLYTPMSKAKHLYILEDVKRLVTRAGCSITWPVDVEPWWDLPHLAWLAARRVGKEREFFWAVYRARWEEGKDICCRSVIRQLARDCRLDPEMLAAAPEDPSIREEGTEALYRCYRDSVFGVPFFILGRERFWGVDRAEDFVRRLEMTTLADPATASVEPLLVSAAGPGSFYESDHAGGCG
jgi:2-hydroxychromene-2-carboxylate isomerase